MDKNEKQYTIYIRSTNEQVPATKQEFDDYYRDINAFRRRQQRHKRCVCPQSKWLSCDMDCMTCPFWRKDSQISLDYARADKDGKERTELEDLPDESPFVDEIVADAFEIKELYARLMELMPEALEVGNLRLSGKNDREIAEAIGIPRKTFEGHIARARKRLEKEFPDFF